MRDLYSRLNVAAESTQAEVEAAIRSCANSSVRDDASEVLLNERRRKNYDQINSTLRDIGRLRSALGLSHADNWRGEVATEYTQPSANITSQYDELLRKLKRLDRNAKTHHYLISLKERAMRLMMIAGVYAAIIGTAWIIAVLFESKPAPESDSFRSRASTSDGDVTAGRNLFEDRQQNFSEPVVETPRNGHVRMHVSASSTAPFEIKTSAGSDYLVKLEDANSGRDIMDIFVNGGSTVEVSVPLGSYVVKYAAGQTWYGYTYHFGPDTSYSKANSIFNFRRTGNQVRGYTITLYQVAHGNLRTSRISASQF